MAVSLAGDAQLVIAAMKCSQDDFREYCEGTKEPPWPELDRLVSLIVREQAKVIARNRELLKALKRRK